MPSAPRFLYVALHYPRPERIQDLLRAMGGLGAVLRGTPGLIDANAWLEKDGARIVAMSTWESRERFQEAVSSIQESLKDVRFEELERKPRELFFLDELAPPG